MDESTAATFRAKVAFMKTWQPENPPSNRDRLELYALHKQAISGDAPSNFNNGDASPGEKARYEAWKKKKGLSPQQAMSAYIAECDRQLRVYGGANPQTPLNTPAAEPQHEESMAAARGIAAIPLLCAAASESRVAYLRRLNRTQPSHAWWHRQEPLCGTPGTLTSLPEAMLLAVASLVETISISGIHHIPLPPNVVQSFLWPLHNTLLSLWMLLILVYTAVAAALSMATTLLWGSRRTGLTLPTIWKEEIVPTHNAVHTLGQTHQPLSVRLVGLVLWPYPLLTEGVCLGLVEPLLGMMLNSIMYAFVVLGLGWWYWLWVVPFLAAAILMGAVWSGGCFALIEFAGV